MAIKRQGENKSRTFSPLGISDQSTFHTLLFFVVYYVGQCIGSDVRMSPPLLTLYLKAILGHKQGGQLLPFLATPSSSLPRVRGPNYAIRAATTPFKEPISIDQNRTFGFTKAG